MEHSKKKKKRIPKSFLQNKIVRYGCGIIIALLVAYLIIGFTWGLWYAIREL